MNSIEAKKNFTSFTIVQLLNKPHTQQMMYWEILAHNPHTFHIYKWFWKILLFIYVPQQILFDLHI